MAALGGHERFPLWSVDTLVHTLSPLTKPTPWLSWALSRRVLRYPWSTNLDLIPLSLFVLFLIYHISRRLGDRLAWGPEREVNLEDEVVVITGGSRGLGRVIADHYAMRGASVAVLDVQPFHESSEDSGVMFVKTDVGDDKAVLHAKELIEQKLGTPSILVNNAGIVNGKRLLDLETSALVRNFNVNLLSHFHTIRAFLPGMKRRKVGGTVVTISSVLGDLGARQLSDYTAAKAGLIAMHASLRSELDADGFDQIKTILVKPGQLATPLFQGVKSPNSFLGPVVEPVLLAREIVKMVDSGRTGVIAMPFYANSIEWMSVLPYDVQKLMRWFSGVDSAMSTFKGQ